MKTLNGDSFLWQYTACMLHLKESPNRTTKENNTTRPYWQNTTSHSQQLNIKALGVPVVSFTHKNKNSFLGAERVTEYPSCSLIFPVPLNSQQSPLSLITQTTLPGPSRIQVSMQIFAPPQKAINEWIN